MDEHRETHILPFLWVHGESEEVYRHMIGKIYDADIRAFCVEARPHEGFCKEPWWHDMDIILGEAERRNMKVWILDDKHFPTGYANGQVRNAPLQRRRQGLMHKIFPVVNGRISLSAEKESHPSEELSPIYTVTNQINGNTEVFQDDRLLSLSALRVDQPSLPVDLMGELQNGDLQWTAPEGEWEIHLCFLTRNIGTHRSYINMMDPESCRIQIDAVYEPHYAHYREKFGKVIAGFFSDEPELGNNYMYRMYNTLGTDQDLPWSYGLEQLLRERLDDPELSLLPLLWSNAGDASLTAKVRFTFMDCVTRLVEESFSHQIGQWCREHNVEYIGHVVEDNNQHARTGTSLGHYFRGLRWQTMAGIDDIGGQVCPGGEDRKDRDLFGTINDGEFYHYALGKLGSSLGALNPNMQGRAMCEIFGNYGWSEGVRLEKYLLDHFMVRGINYFVPHAFTCSPYPDRDCPPHFYAWGNHPQYRHFGKLMGYAERVCKRISGGRAMAPVAILYHGEAEWAGDCMLMQKVSRICLDNQIDFHFVPADVFAERDFYRTEIADKLTVNGNEFQILILPYAQFITPETAAAISELLEHEGRVMIVDRLPDGLTNGERLPESVRKVEVVPLSELKEQLEAYRTVTLIPENHRIRALYYRGEEDMLYLFNEGTEVFTGTVSIPFSGPVCAYHAWEDCMEEADIGQDGLNITLYPSHSLFIVPRKNRKVRKPIMMRGEKHILRGFQRRICRAIEYPAFGPSEDIDKPDDYSVTDSSFSGFICYETEVGYKDGFMGLEITDAYEGVEVFVEGKSAGIQVVPPFRYDLTELCRPGKNRLRIEVATTLERENGGTENGAPTGIAGEIIIWKETIEIVAKKC